MPPTGAAKFNFTSLKARCKDLEAHVVARNLASPDELKARRPGGADNERRDAWAWLRWYGALSQFLARDGQDEFDEERAEAAAVDALRGEPREVRLSTAQSVKVYPKSFHALANCAARDVVLIWLTERAHAIRSAGPKAKASEAQILERLNNEIAYQYALLVWTVTTQGPGLPFDPMAEKVDPPGWALELDPMDMVLICKAHTIVNARRLMMAETLMAPNVEGQPSRRPSWAVFFADASKRYQVPPARLMRDYALSELVAAALLESRPEPVQTEDTLEEEVAGA